MRNRTSHLLSITILLILLLAPVSSAGVRGSGYVQPLDQPGATGQLHTGEIREVADNLHTDLNGSSGPAGLSQSVELRQAHADVAGRTTTQGTGAWRTYTIEDGLGSNNVRAIAIDHAGHKWFGTSAGGVSKFDGTTWTTYTIADGLPYNTVGIGAIAIDHAGHKWFGFTCTWYGGVSRFDGTTWTTYRTADGLVSNWVNAVAVDHAGIKWFGTDKGASAFDGTTWTQASGLASPTVADIAIDHAGYKWFGTVYGVSRFDGATWTTYRTADGLANNRVYAIAIDHAGVKWFGTRDGGVSRFDGTTWTTYTTADGLADNDVRAIAIDHAGHKWFGTRGGVSRFDGTTWTTYTTADGLAHNSVYAIAIDDAGHVWFGTYGGVSVLETESAQTYTISGQVRDASGAGIEGVTVSARTGGIATTDAQGAYTINVLLGGTYTVVPRKSGYEFSPSARIVRVPQNATGQDFTTTPIYGSLTGRIIDQDSGTEIANARVSAAGQVVRSSATGAYELPNLLPGLRNLYVSADGYEEYKGEVVIEAYTAIVRDVALTPINLTGYRLPYPGGKTYQCTQGNGSHLSHHGANHYAFDFGIKDGDVVVASREGRVVRVLDGYNTGCDSIKCKDQANWIMIRHEDNTDTIYLHLKYKSAVVSEEHWVSRGDPIAQSNCTGWCTGDHLHFARFNSGQWKTIPVSFDDVDGDGVPKTGEAYASGNYPTSQPLMASEETVDLDPPLGSVQLRFSGQPTHTLVLSAFDYRTDVSHMRLAATEQKLQTASWTPFITRTTWTEPAVFAQFRNANGNVSAIVSDTLDAIGYEPLQAAFVVSRTVCVNQGLPLANQTTPFCEQCEWLWDFGDGAISEGAEPVFGYLGPSSFPGYAVPGAYTVTLTVKNATTVVSVSQQVEALAQPSADFTLIRSGDTITVEATGTEAADWTWDFGDGVTTTGRIATHTYADPALMGLYPIQLVVQGANSCTGWSHQHIPLYHVYLPLVLRNH